MTFSLVSQDRVVFEGPADAVILPTSTGQITVLANHIPLITVIVPGEVVVRHGASEELFVVDGGFLEVHDNAITLLADASERASEIDVQRAEEAKRQAEESLRKGVTEQERLAVSAAYERSLARLRVVQKMAERRGKRLS